MQLILTFLQSFALNKNITLIANMNSKVIYSSTVNDDIDVQT